LATGGVVDNFFLNPLVSEISGRAVGQAVHRVSFSEAVQEWRLHLSGGSVLAISLDPSALGIYLSSRRELKKSDRADDRPSQSVLSLHKKLQGAVIASVVKPPLDRTINFTLETSGEDEQNAGCSLVLTLTGRSANGYLVSQAGRIDAVLARRGRLQAGDVWSQADHHHHDPRSALKNISNTVSTEEALEACFGRDSVFGPLVKEEFLLRAGETGAFEALTSVLEDLFEHEPRPLLYSRASLEGEDAHPPIGRMNLILAGFEMLLGRALHRYEFGSFSEAAEQYITTLQKARNLQSQAAALARSIEAETKKLNIALRSIEEDLDKFRDPDRSKRLGDLLLANLTTARLQGRIARVTDYYHPDQQDIEIEVGEGKTLQEAAAAYYEQAQKGRRALKILVPRAEKMRKRLGALTVFLSGLQAGPTSAAIEKVQAQFTISGRDRNVQGRAAVKKRSGKGTKDTKVIGRRFTSSEGYEIVVGKTDKENDYITFRVASSLDVWLHTADYPGSHVVIRNPRREAVPFQTILEAAQIAAYNSQARKETRVAVNYTQKKFVTKPPKAKPGLVRLSSFKTLLVEPKPGEAPPDSKTDPR
jgi:predicted ribosome quality control (RQC) complex YloA/Tae2 family protein